MLRNKKGTEKPIEIFIALFIILAVSMVMLKMFNSQITKKSEEMQSENQKFQREQLLEESKLKCDQLCTDASKEGCSAQSIAAFCTRRVGEKREDVPNLAVDLNGDSEIGVDRSLMAGIGVCEDAIYCPLVTSCTCGKKLTPEYCAQAVCEYWESRGMDADMLLNERYENPTTACQRDTDYNKSSMWFHDFPTNCSSFI